MDVHSPAQRSANMAAIRGKNTRPEMIVRSILHRLGYRFRLHKKDLPGRPDLVLVRHRKIVFVHGCFWHMHQCRYGRVVPATNSEFWESKRLGNVTRDRRNKSALRNLGWNVLVVWECWTRDPALLSKRLEDFLDGISL